MLGVLFAAAVATAAPPAPPAQPATPEPRVCHTEPIQGSRITHRVCLKASDAAMLQREARALLDHAQAGSQAPNMATLVPMGPVR